MVRQRGNIRAAIRYHTQFPAEDFCSPEAVYFQHGEQVKSNDRRDIIWLEVSLVFPFPFHLSYLHASRGRCQ